MFWSYCYSKLLSKQFASAAREKKRVQLALKVYKIVDPRPLRGVRKCPVRLTPTSQICTVYTDLILHDDHALTHKINYNLGVFNINQ